MTLPPIEDTFVEPASEELPDVAAGIERMQASVNLFSTLSQASLATLFSVDYDEVSGSLED